MRAELRSDRRSVASACMRLQQNLSRNRKPERRPKQMYTYIADWEDDSLKNKLGGFGRKL
jgi:hypothetical protein